MNDTKIELSKTYQYDVKFNDNTVGQLILSPSAIILKCLNQISSENYLNDFIEVLSCTVINEGLKITLFELTRLGISGHIDFIKERSHFNNTYICKYAIIGSHFNTPEDIQVSTFSVIHDSIRQWYKSAVGPTSFFKNNKIVYELPLNEIMISHELDEFTFSLSYKSNISFSAYEDIIPQPDYSADFTFNKNISFSDMLGYLKKWEILYSIFMGQIELPRFVTFKNESSSAVNELFYYYPIGIQKYKKLHYLQIPVRYCTLSNNFSEIMNNWFKMGDNDKQNIIYFYEAIDNSRDIKQRFLLSVKLIEGLAGKGDEVFFNEEELNDLKTELRKYFKNKCPQIKDSESFLEKLDYTNKHKLDLKDNIRNLLLRNEDFSFLKLEVGLIEELVGYRNTLSHNNSFSKNKKINYNKLYEGCLKFIIVGYLLLCKRFGIPYSYLTILLLHWVQLLRNNSKLLNEVAIFCLNDLYNEDHVNKIKEQCKNLNIKFIPIEKENIDDNLEVIMFINKINDNLESSKISNLIRSTLKRFETFNKKRIVIYIDGISKMIAELPIIDDMQPQEMSECFRKLLDTFEKSISYLDASQSLVYDLTKKEWK